MTTLPRLVCLTLVALLAAGTQARAEAIGPPLVNRPSVDGASDYLFLHDNSVPGFTRDGTVTSWSFFNDNGAAQGGRTLEPVILKKVGSDWVITGVGATVTTPASMSGVQTSDFSLVDGSDVVGPGYTFAHHDLGNPGSIEYTYVGGDSATQRYIAAGSAKRAMGQTLPDAAFSTRQRYYSLQFASDDEPMQTSGDALAPRAMNDNASGSIFVAPDGVFSGRVEEWSFYDANNTTPDRQVTPLIVEQTSPTQYRIAGIGTTRTTKEIGEQHYKFDLVTGSDQLGPGRFFAWKDGANGANNQGVIDYNDNGGDAIRWLGGGHTSFAVGDAKSVALSLGRSYSLQFTDITDATITGDALIDRSMNDSANGAIFIVPDGVFSGQVTEWAFYDNDDASPDRQVTPLIVEQTAATQYQIVGIGTTRTTDETGQQSYAFGLVSGTDQVGPGRFFAWKDGSNGADNQGVIDWDANTQDRILYLGGGKTSFSIGNSYGLALAPLERSYSVQFDDVFQGEVIGDALIDRAMNDGASGGIFLLTEGFSTGGLVDEWVFYDNDNVTANRQIAPLILEEVGGVYLIRGIGATQTTNELGQQSYLFDLIAGSNEVGPGFYFGWKDGSLVANNPGVIDYNDNFSSFDGIRYFGSGQAGNVLVGRNLGGGTFYGRDYSVQARVIPEPATLTLLAVGLGLAARRRRRR